MNDDRGGESPGRVDRLSRVMITHRRPDTRTFLALALAAAALLPVAVPEGRLMLGLVRHGHTGPLSPDRLVDWDREAGRMADDPRFWAARAVLTAAAGEDPRPWWRQAAETGVADPVWLLLRVLHLSGEPLMVLAPGIEDEAEALLVQAAAVEPGNAVPLFYRAVLAHQRGDRRGMAEALERAAGLGAWHSGLDHLNGVAAWLVGRVSGGDLGRVLVASQVTPMVGVRPAGEAVYDYLGLSPASPPVADAERVSRIRRVLRLALLVRGSPSRTWGDQLLSDLLLDHVRSAFDRLPDRILTGEDRRLFGLAIRTASARLPYLHTLQDQRDRLARNGMVALGGLHLALLWWLFGAGLLLVGLAALLKGLVPPGGLRNPAGGGPGSRMRALVWFGGLIIALVLAPATGWLQAVTPSGAWSSSLGWLTERFLVLVGVALLAALTTAWVAWRSGQVLMPVSAALQMLLVAAAVLALVTAAAVLPEVTTIGHSLEVWRTPPEELSLALQLELFPFPH